MPHCDLFGHVNKVGCRYKHCTNVDVDWLNILLSVSASHTITELFQASECTVDPNTLRSGGKFRKFCRLGTCQTNVRCDRYQAAPGTEACHERIPEGSHERAQKYPKQTEQTHRSARQLRFHRRLRSHQRRKVSILQGVAIQAEATQKNGAVVKANISPFSTPQKKHKLDGKQLDAL